MKLNDLAIFVEVAKASSLRDAARRLGLQPGSVSKVVKRIEAYYQQELFTRQGTGWALTSAGEMLFQRAIELLTINEKIERELGKPRRPHLRVSGSEALLSYFLPELVQRLATQQQVSLDIVTAHDLTMLNKHEVDLALVSSVDKQEVHGRKIVANPISQATFVTVANAAHTLAGNTNEALPIEEVLQHPFIVPSQPIYGKMDTHLSHDGWHDEHFSRQIIARADTVSSLIAMVKHQPWLAYLPDYVAREHQFKVIESVGCPYTCEQTIWLCRHSQINHHWMRVFE